MVHDNSMSINQFTENLNQKINSLKIWINHRPAAVITTLPGSSHTVVFVLKNQSVWENCSRTLFTNDVYELCSCVSLRTGLRWHHLQPGAALPQTATLSGLHLLSSPVLRLLSLSYKVLSLRQSVSLSHRFSQSLSKSQQNYLVMWH